MELQPQAHIGLRFPFNYAGNLDLAAFILIRFKYYDPSEFAMTTLSDLTPRELEILRLVLAGQTNKAIGAEIYISEKTVEFHLDNLYTKIGVRTRLMAGVWAMHQGLGMETRGIAS